MNRRRIRIAAWIIGGIIAAGMFTALYTGTQHTANCYTPCDCTHPVDRPCP